VTLFSEDLIRALQAEGHPIRAGAIGENLTVGGLDWTLLAPGVRLRVGGEVLLEITKYAEPCEKVAGAFAGGDFLRVSETRHPGWSRVCARVLEGGRVRVNDVVRVEAGPEDAPEAP
jgi:MOSC domain-containing protein YiiM